MGGVGSQSGRNLTHRQPHCFVATLYSSSIFWATAITMAPDGSGSPAWPAMEVDSWTQRLRARCLGALHHLSVLASGSGTRALLWQHLAAGRHLTLGRPHRFMPPPQWQYIGVVAIAVVAGNSGLVGWRPPLGALALAQTSLPPYITPLQGAVGTFAII